MSRIKLVAFDLKTARKRRGLSQIQTAEILCAKQPSVSRWEAEGTLPELARKAWDLYWQMEDSKHGKKETKRTKETKRSVASVRKDKVAAADGADTSIQRGGNRGVMGRRRRSVGYSNPESESAVEVVGAESASDDDAGT